MRVFIAIELDEVLKEYLREKQQKVRNYSEKGNFTRIENLHLTLRFIGEVSTVDVEKIKEAMEEAAEKTNSFQMTLGSLGEFPRGNKKILWIGIDQGRQILQQLFAKLEKSLEERGYPREEKGLKPHITLGREIVLQKIFGELSKEIMVESKTVGVKAITLMESTRIQGALTYVPIYRRNLQ
ncbi:2'-5' RNA ligase [Anaerosolibacter carboniphilus]|uniref:RNA 2',3'-cyclic phosphodiesterase n=1 Tax=Anaerosolibacter carboniphilus TaxID=1417629 RepID=A0A841KPM0_9FIRM|nr:RNA 2',3'-cyclic phosphodiesterase [Anaerosolibacter carboniphilus]MBB6214038.1 2'-5' RNA ligase [Anaerosolibacter carboniphilus]